MKITREELEQVLSMLPDFPSGEQVHNAMLKVIGADRVAAARILQDNADSWNTPIEEGKLLNPRGEPIEEDEADAY